jgi:hypothetical protein
MGRMKAAKYTHNDKGAGRVRWRYINQLRSTLVCSIQHFPEARSYSSAFATVLQRQTGGNAACGIELCHTSCQYALHCIGPHSSFRMPGYNYACTLCKCTVLLHLVQGHTVVCVRAYVECTYTLCSVTLKLPAFMETGIMHGMKN